MREARTGGRIVTLVEVVSEANKSGGSGEKEYRRKQKEMADAGANLVEIDLLRAGRHVLAVPMNVIPPKHKAAYRACVTRASRPGRAEWYPIELRQRLPRISIPLREQDPDVTLDLQPLVNDVYRKGRYEYIDYSKPPEPPLPADDAVWADALLKSKGLR